MVFSPLEEKRSWSMSGSNYACDLFNTNGPQATYVTFQNHFIPELIQSFLFLNFHWYQRPPILPWVPSAHSSQTEWQQQENSKLRQTREEFALQLSQIHDCMKIALSTKAQMVETSRQMVET